MLMNISITRDVIAGCSGGRVKCIAEIATAVSLGGARSTVFSYLESAA